MNEYRVILPEESFSIMEFNQEELPAIAVVNTACVILIPKLYSLGIYHYGKKPPNQALQLTQGPRGPRSVESQRWDANEEEEHN